MSEASPRVNAEDNTPKAAKDKNCPYCGQAFTSSSLGRHLDLYIKERNPKKQDGIHNVDEIRRLRGGITRRHPKGSYRRRNTTTPAGTPSAVPHRADASGDESSNAHSPAAGGAAHASVGTSAADIASMFPLGGVRWEATGVMNEVLVASSDGTSGADGGHGGHSGEGSRSMADLDTRGFNPNRRPISSRVVSRQAVKAQLDSKQKIQDALDDARAAELALREFANAWRAAKQQIEMDSMPFDFDPLTMNFPALTLQCLRAQPTLFASTQLPTPASWSTTPPGASQFEALKSFFKEEFRKWRVKCAAATTAQYEDLKYPPSPQFQHLDRREAIERAERSADALEQEANKHLEVAFYAWDELPSERQNELWILELARGIATKQTEIDKLKEVQSGLRQEASSLKIQIEQLNRLQQPREFKLVPPSHIPMNEKILFELQDAVVSQGSKGVGLNINDRHSDLSTIVATAIGRWKNVIVSTRASGGGMGAQRSLGTPTATSSVTSPIGGKANQAAFAPATTPMTPSLRSPKQARKNLQSLPQPPARAPAPAARPPAPSASSSTPVAPARLATKPLPRPPLQAPVPDRPADEEGSIGDNGGNADGDQDEEEEDDEDDDDEDEDEEEEEEGEEEEEEEEDGENGTISTSTKKVVQASTTSAPAGVAVDGDNRPDENDDENEETSDKDADAEMEDGDEFAHMHTPISRGISATGEAPDAKAPKASSQLKNPRTRTAAQHIPRTTGASGVGLINTSRSMPNINVAIHGHAAGQHMAADMGLSMNTLGGDAMYMD